MTNARLAKRPGYAFAAGLVWLALLLLTTASQSLAQPPQARPLDREAVSRQQRHLTTCQRT